MLFCLTCFNLINDETNIRQAWYPVFSAVLKTVQKYFMINFPDHTITELLHKGQKSVIYRGVRESDQKPAIIKALAHPFPSQADIARLRYEYQILRGLSIPQVIRAFELRQVGNTPAIICEDWQGASLDKIFADKPIELETFLSIAIQLTIVVGNLHQEGIIHRNIHPGNLIWNLEFQMLQLIDFSQASQLLREKSHVSLSADFDDRLAYISPEQTGRMNRMVDYRSDFYSMGVTFYKLLTGRLPFESDDPLELIHSHIAKLPKAPHLVEPDIPGTLSNIIQKLLSKEAGERYQGSYGLRADLEACLKQLKKTGQVEDFTCGQQDLAEHFQLAQKLYGRDEELSFMLDIFDKSCGRNRKAMVLVGGYAGVGKSSLVYEIQKSVLKSQGYFISGKYDQYNQDIPYHGIVQAFRELIRQILAESSQQLLKWRTTLQKVLGPNGQVIADVIPEILLIIGDQPPVVALGPTKTKNRFILVFQEFISAFSKPEHPLVIFLDDLQSSDASSLQLLEQVIANESLASILMIGAYRTNEVDSEHILSSFVAHIEMIGRIHRLFLEPLPLEIIQQILCDTFYSDHKRAAGLADLIHHKTRGNPFFVGELLQYLVDNTLLQFDSAKGIWEWDLESIKTLEVADNVADFILSKIDRLSPDTRKILSLAAGIGNRFSLKKLAMISQQTPAKVNQILWAVIQEGLLLPLEENYELWTTARDFDENVLDDQISLNFQFQHDRVQQAAYTLIPEDEKSTIHYRIGRYILNSSEFDKADESIFELVHQLNAGKENIESETEKWELARLNLMAGKRAKTSIAYQTALRYLKAAMELVSDTCWDEDYDFSLSLYKEYADCAYSCGELDEAEAYGRILMANTRHQLEKTDVLYMQLIHYTVLGKSDLAIQAGIEGLSRLGLVVPVKPNRFILYRESARIKWRMRNRKPRDLLNVPELEDKKLQMIIKILMQLVGPTYASANKALFAYVCLKTVNLSLKYGHTDGSALAYTCYGVVLGSMFGDFKSGYEFGKLGLELNRRRNNLVDKCRIYFFYATMIHSWNKPWKTISVYLNEGIEAGYQTGDVFYIGHSYNHLTLWNPELNLPDYLQQESRHLDFLKKSKYQNAWDSSKLPFQLRSNLCGMTDDLYSLSDASFDEAECLERNRRDCFAPGYTRYYLYKLQIHFMYEDIESALNLLEEVDKSTDAIFGKPFAVEYCLYAFLTLSHNLRRMKRRERKRHMVRIGREYQKMKKWAKNSPENFGHHCLLMEAELARLAGRVQNAAIIYDQAIEAAQKSGFLQHEALANETTARFYRQQNREKMAAVYLKDACDCYERWGATAKVAHLHVTYSFLNHQIETFEARNDRSLDMHSIIKASQTISEEIVLERLLEKLLTIVIENAGAKKAALLFEENGVFLIKASLELEGNFSLKSIPLEQSRHLPKTVVQFALRTQEVLLLPNAFDEGDFTSDPYVMAEKLKSVLCFPIKQQDKLICLLYLENSLIAKAFTPQQLEMLNLLSAQVAIYIENARLYEELEKSLEQEKLARKAQEKLDQLKDEFLANTSHELRTPLHGMIGLAESLIVQKEQSLLPDVLTSLQTISMNGRRLSNLVNDLLDYSKMKHQRIDLILKPINLWEIVQMVLTLNKPLIESKSLKAVNNINEDLPAVNADENRLQQILNNLVGNAIKFTDQGEVAVSAAMQGNRLEVSVTDTGIGIAEKRVAEIFEPFNQGDGSYERQYGGTGIGLSITKHLVELHGGEIKVKSAREQGSCFSFSLPVTDRKQETDKTAMNITRFIPAIPVLDGQTGNHRPTLNNGLFRVLMVDDEPSNLQVLQNYLAGEPYTITTANNGQEALDVLKQKVKPDIILLDVMMPKMSGFEVCREVRKTLPPHQLPILFLTARNQVPSMLEGFSAGANDYLPKPFSREELLARIQFHLELSMNTRKLTSLRSFSNQIGVFKDKIQIAKTAFFHIRSLVPSSFACLISDNEILEKHVQAGSPLEDLRPPLEQLSAGENPMILESLDPETWQLEAEKSGSLLFFQWDDIQFFLFRESKIRSFSTQDLEYIKTFLNEIRIIRKNIHAVIFQTEPELLDKLIQIRIHLNDIKYLTTAKPNTEVVFLDNNRKLTLRLSLQNIEIFFEEETFIRVHRSYLVNPMHIKKIEKDNRVLSGYRIKMADGYIPIGKTYLNTIKKLLPGWF